MPKFPSIRAHKSANGRRTLPLHVGYMDSILHTILLIFHLRGTAALTGRLPFCSMRIAAEPFYFIEIKKRPAIFSNNRAHSTPSPVSAAAAADLPMNFAMLILNVQFCPNQIAQFSNRFCENLPLLLTDLLPRFFFYSMGAVSFHHHGWFSPGAQDFPESTGYPGQTGCFSSHGPHGSAAGCRKGIAVYRFSSFDLMILL